MRGAMSDGFSVQVETKEVEKLIQGLLNKVQRPKPLLKEVHRYIHAMTMKMFRGPRPDNNTVREITWPHLQPSTIKAKRAKMKRGKSIAERPMVDTGAGRDSIRMLQESEKGFLYGTNIKSKRGFSYMGFHNIGRFPWLFLSKKDYAQIQKMTVDFLKGALSKWH
jgi:hypothetical protein